MQPLLVINVELCVCLMGRGKFSSSLSIILVCMLALHAVSSSTFCLHLINVPYQWHVPYQRAIIYLQM